MKKLKISDLLNKNLRRSEPGDLPILSKLIPRKLFLKRPRTDKSFAIETQKFTVHQIRSTKLTITLRVRSSAVKSLKHVRKLEITNDFSFYRLFFRMKSITSILFSNFDFRELGLMISHFKYNEISKVHVINFSLEQLNQYTSFLKSLTYLKRIRNVIIEREKKSFSIKTMAFNLKRLEYIIPRFKRLPGLESIDCVSGLLTKMDEDNYGNYGRFVGCLTHMRLLETFNFCKDQSLPKFLKPLKERCHLKELKITWGYQRAEEIAEAIGEIKELKQFSCLFKDGIPTKMIQNINKLEQLEKLSWKVDLGKLFYEKLENVIASSKGLLQRVKKLTTLKHLEIDILESNKDVFEIFSKDLNNFKRLEILKIKFPVRGPVSTGPIFRNFKSYLLRVFSLEMEIVFEEESVAIGLFLSNLGPCLEELRLKFLGSQIEATAGPIYDGMKKLRNLRLLKIEMMNFVFSGTGKRATPRIMDFWPGLERIERAWLFLTKGLNDDDLSEFLKSLCNNKTIKFVYLESSIAKIKKANIANIGKYVRELKAKDMIFELKLPEAGHPDASSWN